jgi:large subunit ribosomal protein L9e
MKLLHSTREVVVPEGLSLEVKARQVRVKGPRGQLTRDFKHTRLDFAIVEEDGVKKLRVECHLGKRKSLAVMRTVTSHIQNLFTGVSKGFEYKLRLVYAHFPININIANEGALVEIRNFLGEKRVRSVNMYPGVKCERSSAVKDELLITGNDVDMVSHSAALISGQCHVRKKDIRKFLDGIYIAERGLVVKEE